MVDYNIGHTLSQIAQHQPNNTGLTCKHGNGYKSHTFKELEQGVSAVSHALLSKGVGRGMRVMLMVKPSFEFICLAFALFRLGAVVILIDPGMGYKNLLRCIGSVQPEIFLGIPKAVLFRWLFPTPFATVRQTITIRPCKGLFADGHNNSDHNKPLSFPATTAPDEPAAIIFTTGSTGPPKGVCYEHGVFHAQLQLIRDYYKIGPGEVDQPAFPLFALFSIGLGARAVIPDMDPARPARVNPKKFIHSINQFGVTYSFGSPAIWNVVSNYSLQNQITMPSLKKILMAGAPIAGELVERMRAILPTDAEIHTPYGATECLPLTSISGTEILADTWPQTKEGKGTCVGRPLPGNRINIVPISESPIPTWRNNLLPTGEIGEIVAQAPVATRQYHNNDHENRLAKIRDGKSFWHRMGDIGYLDVMGRLWVCGRKAHRVQTSSGTMFTLTCEAIFNQHPAVLRSALVGVGPSKAQQPVIIVELTQKDVDQEVLLKELADIASQHQLTWGIHHFLIHKKFPTDIRHNAKIFREKLANWAAKKVTAKC